MAEAKRMFEKVGDELMERTVGDQLATPEGKQVPGRYDHKRFYPEITVREHVKQLQREIADKDLTIDTTEQQIKKLDKELKPVDKAFYEKFKSCVARMQMEKPGEVLAEAQKQKAELQDVLEQIKREWPEVVVETN